LLQNRDGPAKRKSEQIQEIYGHSPVSALSRRARGLTRGPPFRRHHLQAAVRGSDDGDRHVGAHEPVPGDEEGLRVVAAGPAKLMMEVMVRRVVSEDEV